MAMSSTSGAGCHVVAPPRSPLPARCAMKLQDWWSLEPHCLGDPRSPMWRLVPILGAAANMMPESTRLRWQEDSIWGSLFTCLTDIIRARGPGWRRQKDIPEVDADPSHRAQHLRNLLATNPGTATDVLQWAEKWIPPDVWVRTGTMFHLSQASPQNIALRRFTHWQTWCAAPQVHQHQSRHNSRQNPNHPSSLERHTPCTTAMEPRRDTRVAQWYGRLKWLNSNFSLWKRFYSAPSDRFAIFPGDAFLRSQA